jgi:hypothetical protein
MLLLQRVLELRQLRMAITPLRLSEGRRSAELGHRDNVTRVAFFRQAGRNAKLRKLRVEAG